MPFKEKPAIFARVSTALENLPRRISRRSLLNPRDRDPEICDTAQQEAIRQGFIRTSNAIADIESLGEHCVDFANCLAGISIADVYITCANCDGVGPSGYYPPVRVCAWGNNWTQEDVSRRVFHELVRLCGAKELDAYALEYWIFELSKGVNNPIPSEVKDRMCKDSYQGIFTARTGICMYWDPSTGGLWPVNYSTGIPTPVGPSLTGNSNTNWQHTCPP